MAIDLASTEYLSLVDGAPSGPGPDLPIHVWGHCLFAIDDYRIILNGGVSREHYSSARTYLFDSEIASWTEVKISVGSEPKLGSVFARAFGQKSSARHAFQKAWLGSPYLAKKARISSACSII